VNIREETEVDEGFINLTPLIDVVFLLLIFFLVTTTFLDRERELEIELPRAETGAEPEPTPEELVLTVVQDGGVYHRGQRLAPEALLALLRQAAERDPSTPVTIRGHRLVHHEAIVAVMDACGRAGLSELAVGTSQDEGS
jgi:biopolymer transport protein ExbD